MYQRLRLYPADRRAREHPESRYWVHIRANLHEGIPKLIVRLRARRTHLGGHADWFYVLQPDDTLMYLEHHHETGLDNEDCCCVEVESFNIEVCYVNLC